MKKVLVSVTSDLTTDQRVHKVCLFLEKQGFYVMLVGRGKKNSLPLDQRSYVTKRMSLLFDKGPFFYAEYNIRLFFFLLFHKSHLLVSNDLDTLLPNFIVSRFKDVELVYDSHEYFTEAFGLANRKIVKWIWKTIERYIFPKLKRVYSVNKTIANIYKNEYGVNVNIVMNLPYRRESGNKKTKKDLGLPVDRKIVLLQGAAIDFDRGAEEAVMAMKYVDNAILLIIGGGLVLKDLKKIVAETELDEKVMFKDRMPYDQLCWHTDHADIGLTLDKDTCLNFKYISPNKLFDYVQAGVPVLASRGIEIRKVFEKYEIGEMIENHDPVHIAEKINFMLNNKEKIRIWKENLKKAALEYCWENEEKELEKIYEDLL